METFKTIQDVIQELQEIEDSFGNLPVLISSDGSDGDFLRPLCNIFTVCMTEKETDDTQNAVVFSNYEIEDATEDDIPMEVG